MPIIGRFAVAGCGTGTRIALSGANRRICYYSAIEAIRRQRLMTTKELLQSESPPKASDARNAQARELERLAHWMDTVFEIPVLKLRFGLDALLGLLPGGGDVGASLVSIYILSAANRYGIPRITVVRMALNIALDMVVGSIPIVGDLFDVYWKSNQRNMALLRRHFDATPSATPKLRRADRLFVAGIIISLCVLLVVSLVLAYLAINWLVTAMRSSTGQ